MLKEKLMMELIKRGLLIEESTNAEDGLKRKLLLAKLIQLNGCISASIRRTSLGIPQDLKFSC